MRAVPTVLDLVHDRDPLPGTVGAFLLPDIAALVDCGAGANLASLESELSGHGVVVEELEHLLLTHIHLDHAGAAGALAARNPRLQVWVHRVGARHLIDPSRLIAGTAAVYGADFERVWGPILPVPADRVHAISDEVRLPFAGAPLAVPTPGHARHHLAYLTADGTCYAGDAAGAAYGGSSTYVEPACPPPDADPPAWQGTIDRLETLAPARLAIAHYGVFEDVPTHLEALRERLALWLERIDRGEESFVEAVWADRRELADPASLDGFWGYAAVERWCHQGLVHWRDRVAAAG